MLAEIALAALLQADPSTPAVHDTIFVQQVQPAARVEPALRPARTGKYVIAGALFAGSIILIAHGASNPDRHVYVDQYGRISATSATNKEVYIGVVLLGFSAAAALVK